MARDEPRVGDFYSCKEQSKLHGGDLISTLPDSGGKVTLIRFKPADDPDGPHIIDHGPGSAGPDSRVHKRVKMLLRQGGSLPVYKFVDSAAWEYLGRYRVQSITDGGPGAEKRSRIAGRPIRYVIRLEEAC
jgi:hypothetical protein